MKLDSLIIVAAFAASLAAASFEAVAQAPIVIKFSHVVAADTPKGKGAIRLKELAEERTKGRVKVEIYANSTLYKDKEEVEALQWGAVPQVLAFPEVYQALQTGVVDGTENPPSNLYTQKMNEVQKYVAVSNHGYLGYAVLVNKKFWDDLPADIRTALEGAMKDAPRYTNAIAQLENDEALAKVKETGKTQVYNLTDAGTAAWKKVLLPVQEEMKSRIGKETVEEVQKEAAASGQK